MVCYMYERYQSGVQSSETWLCIFLYFFNNQASPSLFIVIVYFGGKSPVLQWLIPFDSKVSQYNLSVVMYKI